MESGFFQEGSCCENGVPYRNRSYSLPNNLTVYQGYNINVANAYRPNFPATNEYHPYVRNYCELRSQVESNGNGNTIQDYVRLFNPQVYETSTSAATDNGNVPLENSGTSKLEERTKPLRTGRNLLGDFRYVDLIEFAIYSSPQQQLTLNQIYTWFQTYVVDINERTKGESSWKNSIRHSLSLKKHFIRRKSNETYLWTIDYNEKAKGCENRIIDFLELKKQLEATREGNGPFFAIKHQQLPSISAQDMLPTESCKEAPSLYNKNTEKRSKIAHGFKKGVKKCMQKFKQVVTNNSYEKSKLLRTQSLREGRSICQYAPPSCSYTYTGHHMPYYVECGAEHLEQTSNNYIATTNYAYYPEQHPQLTRSNSNMSNEAHGLSPNNQIFGESTNVCSQPDVPNEFTISFINNNIQTQNNCMPNQLLYTTQFSRDRSSTVSSTSSDYKQDWHYFTESPESEFGNQDCIIDNQTNESEHLSELADELQSSVILQPTNDAVLNLEDNYNQQCDTISSPQICQFSEVNDNSIIIDIDSIELDDLFVPGNSRE